MTYDPYAYAWSVEAVVEVLTEMVVGVARRRKKRMGSRRKKRKNGWG